LYGGWDDHYGFQLYHSDPSGNYFGWKAHCIGANHQTATGILKQDYREDMSLHDATGLALKILSKTIETSNLTSDKLEVATITRVDDGYGGKKVQLKLLKAADIEGLLKAHANMIAPEGPQSTLPS
jgi:20S proteasome subunit alpha 3